MQHPASARLPGRTAAPARSDLDPWLEFEDVVHRLARLVLHAHALAERAAAPAADNRAHGQLAVHDQAAPQRAVPQQVGPDQARAERLRRLRAGADLGSRALQAAVRIDVLAHIGQSPHPSPHQPPAAPSPRSSSA